MKGRLRSAFLILLAVAAVLFCAVLPRVISAYQDASIEAQTYNQNIKDLNLTVQNASPFAKLYLSYSKLSIIPFPPNRAVHTQEEIYDIALEYFSLYQDAGLIGTAFAVSDYECSFRMHAYVSCNNFWHINLYCRTAPDGNDADEKLFFTLTLTIDDETGKVYSLYYAETTETDSGRPIRKYDEVVETLLELYFADLELLEIADLDEDTVQEENVDSYCDVWFFLTDKSVSEGSTLNTQSPDGISEVHVECYASCNSYCIVVAPGQSHIGD